MIAFRVAGLFINQIVNVIISVDEWVFTVEARVARKVAQLLEPIENRKWFVFNIIYWFIGQLYVIISHVAAGFIFFYLSCIGIFLKIFFPLSSVILYVLAAITSIIKAFGATQTWYLQKEYSTVYDHIENIFPHSDIVALFPSTLTAISLLIFYFVILFVLGWIYYGFWNAVFGDVQIETENNNEGN